MALRAFVQSEVQYAKGSELSSTPMLSSVVGSASVPTSRTALSLFVMASFDYIASELV